MTPIEQPPVDTGGAWQYVGLGCVTLVAGLFGGGMLGVLAAKIVGWAQRCVPDVNTGAPCGWGSYWFYGAVAGGVLFPVIVIFLRRRGRAAERQSDRG
ncbi:MAG TPA: hypothetical protein VIJ16_09715 [Gemmatimonadaceae bacterium]